MWNLALGSQAKAHAIKATPLSATCPRHLPCSCRTLTPTCPRTFKTAVCPASNPPNASAGLQGNNSYSYYMPLPSVFQGVQDCRLPALKPPKRFQRSRRPPRQQLLQLHAPAICFSGGSRLPFARPQTPQTLPTLPQASKATTLTATLCQLHAPDIYHAPAELLHLHAPGRSRLPFARPQTLQTLPQASKATTLTATTCPCHLFFRGFKTAVCPPSNPPNASNAPAGLQGNNSYSYMPLPSVFQGVQDCRLPALKPPKRFQRSRRPPRQQLLQLPSVSYMPQTSTMLLPNSYTYMPQDVQDCRLPGLKPSKRFRRPPRQQLLHAPGRSRLPFARPQTLQTLPQASKATTLTATTCPCHLFFRGFKTAVCPPSNPPNASNAPAGLQGNNSYSYMPLPSVFQGVQDCRLPALKPPKRFQRSRRPPRQQLLQLPSVSYMPQTSTMLLPNSYTYMPQDVQDCRLPGLKPSKRFRRPPRQQLLQLLHAPAICFSGVQDCRLPALKPPKRFQRSRRPPRQQLLQLHAPAICFSGGSRLPFARPQTPQTLPTLPQASKATTLTATCPQTLQTLPTLSQASQALPSVFQGFKTAVCPPSNPPNASNAPAGLQGNNSYSYYMPLPSVFQGVQDCRLPALKPPKRFQRSRRPPRQQLLQLHAPAICFSGGSRLPFARPQTPQTLPTLPQASKATTLTATLCQLHAPDIYHAPAELLHLHAPGRSRLPFARPQTLQTLPQASKATTLTATTCPCHLFFRGFKTAVCPPSNPPNASNAPAGLQGNNSYSYMPLPSVFQGVQDCRLPALKPPKRFQRSRRPPRQQLLQLHVPAICFSGGSRLPSQAQLHAPAICFSRGSRLPFARPQTLQTLPALPQASKATTLTATCPCHLFFRGFKTAVCPPSNPPNASNAPAGLQGNNSYSYMSLPSVFQGFKTAVASKGTRNVCPASNPPNASARLQGNNSYSYYMPLPSVFQGVQDCRLPALKPPKRFQRSRRPPRQQLLQLHAPAICFSRGSRLPFARPQTSQTLLTLPQASKATTLTATLCQLHAPDIYHAPAELLHLHAPGRSRLPFARPQTLQTLPQASKATTLTCLRTFKTAVCPASNPPNASAGLQGNNSYSYYMPLPSVFQGVQDCRLPALKPPKRFQRSRRPPRQQLLQLHAPAICFSGGSRLPFARPQTPQTLPTLPQASKATTLTATLCQLHAPDIYHAPAELLHLHAPGRSRLPFARPQTLQTLPQASKATTLTATTCPPLPSVFQGVQDCRLPALKPPKRFQRSRRPPRQQLLQLHAPAICFSGGSRLPFARPQTPQTLPTLPQASKATTLTATCPQTLQTLPTLSQASQALPSVFQGFKTAVCPPSNPPNASNAPAGLQGNNSYSYMSSNPDLTDVFFLLGKLCGYCVPTAAWALHVSRALRYHVCAFEANDASAADCGLSRQSLATFGTNKA